MVIEVARFITGYQEFSSFIPPFWNTIVSLLIFTAIFVIYVLFSFYLYKIIAKRNIFNFNFNQFNKSESKFWKAVIHFVYFVFEYLILIPAIICVWLAVFVIFIWLMLKSLPIETTLILATALVITARIIGYISEDVSDQFSNLLPFIVLPGIIMDPEIFNVPLVFTKFFDIPSIFGNVLPYVFFIFLAEFVFRILFLIGNSIKWNKKK